MSIPLPVALTSNKVYWYKKFAGGKCGNGSLDVFKRKDQVAFAWRSTIHFVWRHRLNRHKRKHNTTSPTNIIRSIILQIDAAVKQINRKMPSDSGRLEHRSKRNWLLLNSFATIWRTLKRHQRVPKNIKFTSSRTKQKVVTAGTLWQIGKLQEGLDQQTVHGLRWSVHFCILKLNANQVDMLTINMCN